MGIFGHFNTKNYTWRLAIVQNVSVMPSLRKSHGVKCFDNPMLYFAHAVETFCNLTLKGHWTWTMLGLEKTALFDSDWPSVDWAFSAPVDD